MKECPGNNLANPKRLYLSSHYVIIPLTLLGANLSEGTLTPTRTVSRSVRLAQIQHTLHKSIHGLTSRELAELCGCHVRTIQRDLFDLQAHLDIPLTQDGDRYGIENDYGLPPVFFSAYEAIALFLACRLALRQADRNNPHMRQALAKMSAAMPPELAARLRLGINDGGEETDSDFGKAFEAVGLAWITQRQVKLRYLSQDGNQLKEWLLEPYFMEMSGAGRSTYVIGHAFTEGLEGLISFRFDRIKHAEILLTSFDAPSDGDLEKLLSSAWGTMWREQTEARFRLPGHMIRQATTDGALSPSHMVSSYSVALHISSWLEIHSLIHSDSQLEELTPALLEQHFNEHMRKLERSCCIMQPERRTRRRTLVKAVKEKQVQNAR